MQVNIEKILSTYNSFFADGKRNTDNNSVAVKGYTSVSYESGVSANDKNTVMSYDKNSMLQENWNNEENKNLQTSQMSMEEFLNSAMDTLKNLVTEEDYSRMAELGITADKEDMGTLVTVYERIQIQLAAYGNGAVTSLNISSEKIDKVLKSEGLANGVKMAQSIGQIDDNAKEYLIKNEMEPTVENVYKAVYSNEGTSAGRQNMAMTDEQWEQLKPQVEKFLEKNGIEAGKETVEAAKWLMDRQISLSTDNIVKYMKLEEIESTDRNMESVKANMILAELFGAGATNGYMTDGWMNSDKISDAVDVIANADDASIEYIAENDLTLNIANLKKYANAENRQYNENQNANQNDENRERKIDYAKQVIMEAKAVMTMEGAALMEKLGVDITYTPIEEIVNTIKQEENKFVASFLENPDEKKTDTLRTFMNIMKDIRNIPVAAVGAVVDNEEHFDIQNIYNEGSNLKSAYEKAGQTYEAVGTEVRRDLGDSITKAFANIDNIIEDTGLTVNEDTRRAVRILGYNSMNITKESIIEIAEKASEVDRVIKNITPKTAAYLIEKGINPLEEDIEVLNDRLVEINEEIGADANEQYSKYLWKLEKSGKVTKEERQAYIELYRALKTIEKADTRAIGAVAEEGLPLTLGNLLTAEKSRAKTGMNVAVDEKTGYYEGRLIKNKLADILENITNKTMEENTTVDRLAEIYLSPENMAESGRLNNQYEAYIMEDIKDNIEKAKQISDAKFTEEMMLNMMEGKVTPTAANLAAEAMLMTKGNEIRMMLKDRLNSEKRILDEFESEEKAKEAYDELNEEAKKEYKEALDKNATDYIMYRNLCMVTGIMVKSAENKAYNIPVDINGEDIMVKVKFLHSDEDKEAKVEVSLKDETLGNIKAVFKGGTDVVSGMVVCSNEDTGKLIEENMNVFKEMLGKETDVKVVSADAYRTDLSQTAGSETYTDRKLYEMAKTFLKSLKVWCGMPINNVD